MAKNWRRILLFLSRSTTVRRYAVWYHFSHCGGAGRGERRELGRLVIHEHQNNERRHIAGFWLKCKRDLHGVYGGTSAAVLLSCCTAILASLPNCSLHWSASSRGVTVSGDHILPLAVRNSRRRQRRSEKMPSCVMSH